jgi:hypothetical protein
MSRRRIFPRMVWPTSCQRISRVRSLSLPTFARRLLNTCMVWRHLVSIKYVRFVARSLFSRWEPPKCYASEEASEARSSQGSWAIGMDPYTAEWSYSEWSTNTPCNVCHYLFWNRWRTSSRVGQDEIVMCFLTAYNVTNNGLEWGQKESQYCRWSYKWQRLSLELLLNLKDSSWSLTVSRLELQLSGGWSTLWQWTIY